MPGDQQNGSGRMDRMERLMEMLIDDHVKFVDEHKQLLTAQVVLTDRIDKLAQTTELAIRELKEAQTQTNDRLNALITMVDGLIHKRPEL
jgi:hypothetical protein